MNDMRVDIVGLRETWPAFNALSANIEDALCRLTDALAAEGPCWGADEPGTAFAEEYVGPALRLCGAFGSLRDGVRDIGDAVRTAADAADGAELRATQRLS